MAVTKEDLALVDALVAGGCINRSIAREVVDKATPGMVATYISERGYAIACHGWPTIVDRLAKAEELVEMLVDKASKATIPWDLPETDLMEELDHVLAQLRHLYRMMLDGDVKDTRMAALGILGPSIVRLEGHSRRLSRIDQGILDAAPKTGTHLDCTELHDVCPHKPETD